MSLFSGTLRLKYKMRLHYVHPGYQARCRQYLTAARSSCVQCPGCWTPSCTSRRWAETSILSVRCADPSPTWLPTARRDACLDQCSAHSAYPDSHIQTIRYDIKISKACPKRYKKLRYREEHSASVMLSWCTLWHLSGDKQQSNS